MTVSHSQSNTRPALLQEYYTWCLLVAVVIIVVVVVVSVVAFYILICVVVVFSECALGWNLSSFRKASKHTTNSKVRQVCSPVDLPG